MPRQSALARTALTAALALCALASPALAIDEARRVKGEQIATKAIEFLRTQQDKDSGGWNVPKGEQGKGRAHYPAITALVLNGMLMHPTLKPSDDSITRGAAYVLRFRQADGGIYDGDLPSYNTAISLSMLARLDTPEAKASITPAQDFLRNNQWGSTKPAGGKEAPAPAIAKDNPAFGGWGYGNRARPDISNSAFAIQALHESGLPPDDPAFQRAIVFLQRLQMVDKFNDMPYADASKQGGFIYAPGENAQTMGQGNSFAGMIEESADDGTKVSRLRAYGSTTYLGFKSYVFAGLKKDDERVTTALAWARAHYNVLENPGMGTDGFYYYILAMARALDATGSATLDVTGFEPFRVSLLVDNIDAAITDDQITSFLKDAGKINAIIRFSATKDAPARAMIIMAGDKERQAALDAFKSNTGDKGLNGKTRAATLISPLESKPGTRDWQNDMIDVLATLQKPDGSFRPLDDRWMENSPELIAAYSLLAIQHILRD